VVLLFGIALIKGSSWCSLREIVVLGFIVVLSCVKSSCVGA
jgi:hypothetical protein